MASCDTDLLEHDETEAETPTEGAETHRTSAPESAPLNQDCAQTLSRALPHPSFKTRPAIHPLSPPAIAMLTAQWLCLVCTARMLGADFRVLFVCSYLQTRSRLSRGCVLGTAAMHTRHLANCSHAVAYVCRVSVESKGVQACEMLA